MIVSIYFAGIRGIGGIKGESAIMYIYLDNKHKLSTLVVWLYSGCKPFWLVKELADLADRHIPYCVVARVGCSGLSVSQRRFSVPKISLMLLSAANNN